MIRCTRIPLFIIMLTVAALLAVACGGASSGGSNQAAATPEPLPEDVIERALAAYNGSIGQLRAAGDTLSVPLNVSGTTQAFALTGGNPPCPGWVNTVPDFIFQVGANLDNLVVSFDGSTNGTLMIVGPEGRDIFCTDEGFSGRNPVRPISQPEQGGYAVFVGRANLSGSNQGMLVITGQ
jgi:hypothetical protein